MLSSKGLDVAKILADFPLQFQVCMHFFFSFLILFFFSFFSFFFSYGEFFCIFVCFWKGGMELPEHEKILLFDFSGEISKNVASRNKAARYK